MIQLTESAAGKVKELLVEEGRSDIALRVAVQPGGCSGLRYAMYLDDQLTEKDVADKLRTMNYTGMCGALNFGGGPVPGVGIMKPAGVQWKKGTGKFPYELKIVDNSANPDAPIEGDLQPTNA